MLERGEKPSLTTPLEDGAPSPAPPPLEQRVQQLEDAVAQLQQTEQLEERVASRVSERVSKTVPVAQPAAPTAFFVRPPQALLPVPVTTIHQSLPEGATQPANGPPGLRAFFDVLADLRAVWRMYVDPRYRVTWSARVIAPVLVVAIFTSWIWVPVAAWLPSMLGTLYIKLADLLLAFFLCRILIREARRYRDAFPDTPAQH
jgi:hypothetical protein